MIQLFKNGAYLVNGTELVEDDSQAAAKLTGILGQVPDKAEAAKQTMAYGILEAHNTSGSIGQTQS